jgi:amino acid transporter
LLFLRRINHREHADYRALPVITGIVIAALIFSVWGLASIMHTAPGKLAESTIPFTVAARKIFGQNGRLVMGVVLIAGTAGVVNALFIGVSRMLSGMAMEGLLPHWMKGVEKRSAIPLMLISGGIAILMAMGVAPALCGCLSFSSCPGSPAAEWSAAFQEIWAVWNHCYCSCCYHRHSRRTALGRKRIRSPAEIHAYHTYGNVCF